MQLWFVHLYASGQLFCMVFIYGPRFTKRFPYFFLFRPQ